MRLILMRHAKSDWSLSGDDHARPLNPRGRRSAQALGDWLRDKGYLPDEVLCSTAARTRQTLDLLGLDTETRFEPMLYHASAETMLDVLHGASGATVLMVGHNPGIADLAMRLVATPPEHTRFTDYPTGATLVAEWDGTDWAALQVETGQAAEFIVPRELF